MAAHLANFQQQLDNYKVSLEKSLNDKSKPWYKGFKMVEEKTNIPRFYLFLDADLGSYMAQKKAQRTATST